MKYLLIKIFISFTFCVSGLSQECKESVVNIIFKNYQAQNNIEKRIINKSLIKSGYKKNNLDSLNYISIPSINYNPKIVTQVDLKIDSFFCYLNPKKLNFDDVLIYNSKDSSYVGVVSLCPSRNCKYELKKINIPYSKYCSTLFDTLLNIHPQLIFKIYGISDVYWFIKTDKLFALRYDRTLLNFEIFDSEEYIKNFIRPEDIIYLKQVKAIG